MKIGSKSMKGTALSLMMVFFTASAFGQIPQRGQQQRQPQNRMPQQGQQQQQPTPDLSDEELKTFLQVSDEVNTLQAELQENVKGMAEEEGLDMKTFQQMNMAQMQGQQQGGEDPMAEYSDEQQKSFEKVMGKAQKEQQKMRSKLEEIVEAKGMEMQEFQKMAQAIQTSQELQKRLQTMSSNE